MQFPPTSHSLKKPLASILISAYNSEKYIGECLDSALGQTYKNIEVIVIDTGSTDRTPEIIQSYKDPQLRYLKKEERLPIIKTRNLLLKEARGEFLTWLDSDDIYLPDKVAEEVKFLEEHPQADAVYCDLRYFFDGRPDKLYRHRYEFYSGEEVFRRLLEKMFITNTSFMFRKAVYEKIGGYNEELGLVEDWEYFLRMARAGYWIEFLDKDLVRYRLRWDSHTNFKKQAEIQRSAVKIFENLKNQMSGSEREKYDIDYFLSERKENLIVALLANGRKKEAADLLRGMKNYVKLSNRVAIFLLLLLPAAADRFLIERAWNFKKKSLFVPVA